MDLKSQVKSNHSSSTTKMQQGTSGDISRLFETMIQDNGTGIEDWTCKGNY